MKRRLARLATALLAAPLALVAGAGTAAAEDVVVLPGCWGAGTAVVCNATLSVGVPYSIEVYETSVPVCAGTCVDVPVALVELVSTGDGLLACASWTNEAGTPTGLCGSDVDPKETVADLAELVVGFCESDLLCDRVYDELVVIIKKLTDNP